MQRDVNDSTDATRWTGSGGGEGGMTMLGIDDPSRPARVARVRDDVAAGRYHPPADAVAERLLAFFGQPLPR